MSLTASICGSLENYTYSAPCLPRSVMHLTSILEAFDPSISQRTELKFGIDASNIDLLIAESHRPQFDAIEYVDAKIHLGEWQQIIDSNPGIILWFAIS